MSARAQAAWTDFVIREEDATLHNLPKKPDKDCKRFTGVTLVSDDALYSYGEDGNECRSHIPFKVKLINTCVSSYVFLVFFIRQEAALQLRKSKCYSSCW